MTLPGFRMPLGSTFSLNAFNLATLSCPSTSTDFLEKYNPDYIILGGARILKEHVIKSTKFGILNSHPAILPKYRGLDCVAWTILENDSVGATVHYIDPGVDSGPIILQETVDYSDCNSLLKVRIKVMKKCAELMVRALLGVYFNTLTPIKQDSTKGVNHE